MNAMIEPRCDVAVNTDTALQQVNNEPGYFVSTIGSTELGHFYPTRDDAETAALLYGNGYHVEAWLTALVSDLDAKGYSLTPWYADIEKFGKYGDGQQYPPSSRKWLRAQGIGLRLPLDTILIDLDGHHGGAASVETVAETLGLSVAELNAARVQVGKGGQSIHWVFKVAPGHKIKASTGEWLPGVDVKVGNSNGLVNVKPGKQYNFPHASDLVQLDFTRLAKMLPLVADVKPLGERRDPVVLASVAGGSLLDRQINRLASTTSNRNHTLNEVAVILGHYVAGGDLPESDVVQRLTDTARSIGLDESEIAATIKSGIRKGMQEPQNLPQTAAEIFAGITGGTISQTTESVTFRSGYQLLAITQQVEKFKGCTYVADQHRMLLPNGSVLRPEAFNSRFGGYIYQLDDQGKATTRKAFECFTESQVATFPKADTLDYDPGRPFGTIEDDQGVQRVNAFYYRPGERVAGDVSWFTNHLAKLLPVESDRNTLLDWMAYKVQNPGACMRWVPTLVGVPGNGKTTIADMMMYAIGENHCAIPQSNDLDNKFNSWVFGNMFAVINDFKVGDKRDIMETLKPIVSDPHITVQPKGQDARLIRNYLGIMITTNHPDGVVKTEDDRRYAVFMTAQANPEDLIRDGMGEAYFNALYQRINNGGRAAVAYMLANRVVASMPHVAPRTSSHDAAIEASRSPAQAIILQHVADKTNGFCADLIIGNAARDALEREGVKVTGRALGTVLSEVGYTQHPGLPGGRTRVCGFMTAVYVKRGSLIAQNVTQGPELARLSGYAPGAQGNNTF